MRPRIIKHLCNGFILLLSLHCMFEYQALAGHLSGSLGYFNLRAKTSDGTASINNLGLLRIQYDHPFSNQVSLTLGYSLYSLRSVNSDMGYGLDFGAKVYPLSQNKILEESGRQISIKHIETWRPFIGLNFGQRQYQSIQSSYVGPGLELGSEWVPNHAYFITGSLRYLLLRGPANSSIHDFSISLGVGLPI